MSTSKQRLSAVPDSPVSVAADAPAYSLRRDIALALIVVALLMTGVALGGMFAPHAAPAFAAPSGAQESKSTEKFVYFPSQYVNQGVDIPEPTPTF